MLKRVLGVSVLGVGVFALQGDVEAHLAGTVYKPTYKHISSYDCEGHFAQIPNLSIHPAMFECSALVDSFEFMCANPEGKLTKGNSGPRIVTQVNAGQFVEADITDKKKGRATKNVRLPETVFESADQLCHERNNLWFATDELVLSATVRLKTFDCANDDCTVRGPQAFEALLACTIPPGYSLPNNPPPDGVATDYDCTLLAEAHCDKGDTCPIP